MAGIWGGPSRGGLKIGRKRPAAGANGEVQIAKTRIGRLIVSTVLRIKFPYRSRILTACGWLSYL